LIVKPSYVALVRRLAELIPQWCELHPGADLKWLSWGGRIYAANLASPLLRFLADSDDARALLEWLDVQTEQQATLLQALVALELCGMMPKEYSTADEFGGAFQN
jgi:hypothetical protein